MNRPGASPLRRIRKFDQLGVLLGLVAICVLLSILSDRFLTVNNMMLVLRQISINAILAAGMTFVIISGGIDLSVGSLVALTGVIAADLSVKSGSIGFGMLSGVLTGAVIGLCSGVIIAKQRIPPFIATLTMLIIARGLALVYTEGYPIFELPAGYDNLGSGFLGPLPLPILLMFAIYGVSYLLLARTNFGFYTYAIGGNEDAAHLAGINVNRLKIAIYALNGMLAGVAGVVLSSRLNTGQPTVGEMFELDAIAAVVLGGTKLTGGTGTLLGTLIGACIIGVIANGLNLLDVPSFYQYLVKGGVILGAVVLDTFRNRR